MRHLYAMRRANGDWFAFENLPGLRLPLFSSSHEALQARARNWGMLLFKPALFDERALNDVTSTDGENVLCFWLAAGSSTRLNHGNFIDRAQLALIIHDSAKQLPGPSVRFQ